ncbi:MAG: hypothetical protein AAFN11_07430, partial [Chloroflexota bacterium]
MLSTASAVLVAMILRADLDFREDELDTAGTAFALDQVATEVLLSNRASLIDQTETQSARNIIATSTAE